MTKKIASSKKSFPDLTVGTEKRECENILRMNPKALLTLSDRKNIHAKTVKQKVTITAVNSLNVGRTLPAATVLRLFLFVLNKIDGMMNKAFKNPQIINVQFAPCQKPLTKNIRKVFLTLFQVPPLLPPNGIYK